LNTKSNTLFSVSQVKQKQQDLKKEYYNVNDLLAGSGFGWDNARMIWCMHQQVFGPGFAAPKNIKDALHWHLSFPYFDALAPLHYGELCIVLIISAFV